MSAAPTSKEDETAKRLRRAALKKLNQSSAAPSKASDSSLKKHTALIKRMRQSMGSDTRDQNMNDINTLVLEKHIEEIASAVVEGLGRCKAEKDVWSAVEVASALHRRFPNTFTPPFLAGIAQGLLPPSKEALSALAQDQREKEEAARVIRQRPLLRVYAELALVGVLTDGPGKSGGDTILKTIKDLLSGDPQLGSLPLLTTFLKSYALPFLGVSPVAVPTKQQNGTSETTEVATEPPVPEEEELIEKDVRERVKKMCEGYYSNVSKKLVREHERLQEQDRRNHEAYIRSGEIFEDRQQAYEKMAKGYEKLLTSCQSLSDLLHLPMPNLPKASAGKAGDSIAISLDSGSSLGRDEEWTPGGKWEDEEERRFYEELTDIRDFVPLSALGIEAEEENTPADQAENAKAAEAEVKQLEEELQNLSVTPATDTAKTNQTPLAAEDDEDDAPTPVPTPPRTPSPPPAGGPGPHQLITALLAKLPDATNKELIDQAAVDFAFLNSKAARRRLVKHLSQVPKNRLDLLPYYARLVATLSKYMPDIATDLIDFLDEQFRYLQKKKRVIKELADTRRWNIAYISALTKFSLVPTHIILHIYKTFVDDFSGVNIDNIAMLLEGCGRFLLRDETTGPRMHAMVELMRRKQSLSLLDQRQTLLLENAYYMCNPPERGPRQEKQRSPMVQFMRHLIYDVLAKKTLDKVLKSIRKLDWEDPEVPSTLHKLFTRPWKVKYSNVGLLAALTYDLQRYHQAFSFAVVDQAFEDVRRGMELNIYKNNQRRVATMKFIGELYIYRMISSSLIFDTLWSLVTFGHPNGRPLPGQVCPIDVPDDYFRVRLVCVLLDSCGMCFEKGSLKKKLDSFLKFFQLYVLTKDPLPMDVDFMLTDTIEALRPNLAMFKTFEEAAAAVDQMLVEQAGNAALNGGRDDSDRDSDDENDERQHADDDDMITNGGTEPTDEPGSPTEEAVVLKMEHSGPTVEEDDEFNKELAKMLLDSAQESRKVDKKAASVMWETSVMPGVKKQRTQDTEISNGVGNNAMKFTVLSRRGAKQLTKELVVPETAPIAVHTRNAQLQDKVEQQQLKKLVLDYEYREEMQEYQSNLDMLRQKGVKIRFAKNEG